MTTFTTFNDDALARYLIMFGLGDLHASTAIVAGIENSNYFVTLNQHDEKSEYVLTIGEGLTFDEMPFFNRVLQHLYYYGLPIPAPKHTLDGMTSTIFCGKPTFLFPKLPGGHLVEVGIEQCAAIGKVLAEIHTTLATEDLHRDNPFSPDWMEDTLQTVAKHVTADELTLLTRIAGEYEAAQDLDLPKGIIHGDLFRDNVLFDGGEITGILDFFHACDDFLIQDIAITINDWCRDEAGGRCTDRRLALIDGYCSKRELTPTEFEYLMIFEKFSAARFALTRLISGEPGEYLKDPKEFLSLARQLDEQTQSVVS
jgi:homoserine kinase type II|tara:strand:+ start:19 stop:957 length:939 start_codon:yes stop_codon:yes gene_type:complete